MNTTKPYTELGYLVGSQVEQHISVLHTQNIRPNWNFVFNYRLYNAPGTFNSQNTNHNNILFNSDYTSPNQRYHAFVILLNNALQSAENGGIVDPDLLVNENPAYNDRFNIPTQLASSSLSSRNFFNVKLGTGNRYVDKHALLRQRYDFGRKDSIVTDSSVVRYFLPKLSFEHTVHASGYDYRFLDVQAAGASAFYKTNYGFNTVPDTVDFQNKWNVLRNDFSVIQFPDSKNLLQFFKAGATLMNYSTSADNLRDDFINIMVHGEYRNTTRNRKWDMLLYGEFYSAGRDIGNYQAQAKLQRSLGPKFGILELGFQNINRSPSYLQVYKTGFPIEKAKKLNNENVTAISGSLYLARLKTKLSFEYFLQSNYTYFRDFTTVDQHAPLFNFARAGLSKETSLGRKWKWYLDVYLQEAIGDVPINLPRGYARTRIAYEGKPYRNLVMATGIDIRYFTPYYADDYSPVNGQFFYQNLFYIQNRPDVTAYMNFRIRSFTAYVRLENLNTATQEFGFGFKKNNITAPFYPNPGMVFRLGIFWNFVN
jgi:Trp operon repressor